MTSTLTPTSILKARFSELADSLDVNLAVRQQGGKFYFTARGHWKNLDAFRAASIPGAWMTSAAGAPDISEYVYGLPLKDVEKILTTAPVSTEWLEWSDSTVVRIAQRIRDEEQFDHLPILADALEDAGCTRVDLLEHCRAGAAHRHVCWVLELILGPSRKRRPKK